MAIIANTYKTYEQKGIRESLSDVIYNISPAETPFVANVGRASADNTFEEWQQDALAAADATNAQLEGDDIDTFPAVTPTVRIGNRTQISRKLLILSDTSEKVNKAGRKSEEAYQMSLRSKELKTDIEKILIGTNQFAVTGSASVARKTAALLSWVLTNVDKAGDGANPSALASGAPTDARTDGTQRAFTETILKNVVQLQFTSGGKTDVLMVGPAQKQVVSGFAGIATKTLNFSKVAPIAIVGAADIYVSDFGQFSVVPNRLQRNRDAWFLDLEYLSVAYLRPFKRVKLAKTGDAEKRMLIVEYMLHVGTEKAQGLAADLS